MQAAFCSCTSLQNPAKSTHLQESSEEGAEAKDASGGVLDAVGSSGGGRGARGGRGGGGAACGGVRARGSSGAGGARLRRASLACAIRASCAAGGHDGGARRNTTDDDGGGAADRDLEAGERARDVLDDVGGAGRETSRDGCDLRLGGDAWRESGLSGRDGRLTGDHTERVGHGEVAGRGVGVGDAGRDGGGTGGNGHNLIDLLAIASMRYNNLRIGTYSRVVCAALSVGGSHEWRSDEDGGTHLDVVCLVLGCMRRMSACCLAMRSRY